MSRGSQIDVVLKDLTNHFKTNRNAKQKLKVDLENIVRKVYVDSINQNKGYCISFKNVESDVLALYDSLGLDQPKVLDAYVKDWELPTNVYMARNPYYHILLTITTFALHQRYDKIATDAMTILLIKMWNGRKSKFIQYCNVDTMRYVVANLSGKYYARKYDSPLLMISDKFSPSLVEKYRAQILRDSKQNKRLFDQSFGRIYQLFVQGMKPDITTGKSKATGGLATLYHAAKKSGYSISSPKILASNDDTNTGPSLDMYTSDTHEESINNITTFIIVNNNPNYSDPFVKYVGTVLKNGKEEQIRLVMNSIHNIKYTEHIKEILGLMFKQLPVFEKSELCSVKFFSIVKQKIISSKHSPNVTQIKQIVDLLLDDIFRNKFHVSYNSYSTPVRGKCRTMIFMAFAYNIQKYICGKK